MHQLGRLYVLNKGDLLDWTIIIGYFYKKYYNYSYIQIPTVHLSIDNLLMCISYAGCCSRESQVINVVGRLIKTNMRTYTYILLTSDLVRGRLRAMAAGEEDIGAETFFINAKVMAEPGTEDGKMKKTGKRTRMTNLALRHLRYFGGQ